MSNLNFLHSGGNKVTLSAPASNPSSDITFKLPQSDGSAGQVLQTDGNGNLSWVTLPSSGLTMADQWRVTSNVSLNNGEDFLTSNWERVDGSGQGVLIPSGGMTQSGGIFTFPSTGIYRVEWEGYFEDTGSASSITMSVYVTTDNNTYNRRAQRVGSITDISGSTYAYGSVHCQTFVDVTDVTQVKVKFRVSSGGSVAFDANNNENRNCATFTRLGDT